jgi:serine/threonine protein phosphatase PrpC
MPDIFETHVLNKISIVSGSYSNKGIRRENEDSLLVLKDIVTPTFMVADGAGGYHFGKEASSLSVSAFKDELSKLDYEPIAYVKKLIKKKYEQVNKYLYNKSSETEKRMMTTLSMVNIINNEVLISNLGDTVVFRISNGDITTVSKLHSLAWEQYENKQITYEQYLNHPRKNVITKALGGAMEADPFLSTVDVEDGDIYVICTDGVYNFVRDSEILDYFKEQKHTNESLDKICKTIGDKVLERNGNDNLTIVVFQIFKN